MAQFKFEINRQASIAEIGKRVEEAPAMHDESARGYMMSLKREV